MRLFEHANYDFLGRRRLAISATLAFVALGFLTLGVRGPNESIEFTGGTLVQVTMLDPAVDIAAVRASLANTALGRPDISTFGADNVFVIRARLADDEGATSTQATADAVRAALTTAFGAGAFEASRGEAISAKVGRELRSRALLAVLLSFVAVLLYITVRFEWRFGVAAILATAHDVGATIALIGLADLEITLVLVAAVLTILGYSLNDTIVVFDRVRENLHKFKRAQIHDILNRSVNETLPRTVLTGGTTLMALLALLTLGGPIIRDFAFVMTFGVVIGTFSSIFIASPLLLLIERRWPGEDVRGARTLTADRPQPEST